jgi:hypothetical protein
MSFDRSPFRAPANPPKRHGDMWIVAGVGDPARIEPFLSSPDTVYLRAFDGEEVALAGEVVSTRGQNVAGEHTAKVIGTPERRGGAPAKTEIDWRPIREFTASSPDGTVIAKLMELLAIDRAKAPDWFFRGVYQARKRHLEDENSRTFYEMLVAQGIATSATAGQWGTCDFEEWRYRASARRIDSFANKLFAIHCHPLRPAGFGAIAGPADVVTMCASVAPSAYYVCVRNSSVSRDGEAVGLDLEVEAGHIPPADWIPADGFAPTRFEISAPVGAKGNSTLVVPSGQRSEVQSLHFDLRGGDKTVNVTVFDDRKRRYDLPIDLF